MKKKLNKKIQHLKMGSVSSFRCLLIWNANNSESFDPEKIILQFLNHI